jgi:glycosyltransferase involved in cell wall biosynthesis
MDVGIDNDSAVIPARAQNFAVSVVIPTKNRSEQLRETICSVLDQTVKCQIIVVDDASTDDTQQMVLVNFPEVRFEKNKESRGPAASRNRGAVLASGEILITLDDDCVLCRNDAVAICLQWFDSPEIAAVTLPFVNLRQDNILRTAAPEPDQAYATVEYFGGMIAFRRSEFLLSGGYRAEYFMHHEEPDLAIRMLERGRLIRNGNVVLVSHSESPTRDRTSLWRLGARNAILYALFNVPLVLLPLFLAATVTKTLLFAVKHGGSLPVMKGFLDAIANGKQSWQRRDPVSWKTYRIARKLRRLGPTPISKVQELLSHA